MDKKTKLDITKDITKSVVGICVAATVANIVRNNVTMTSKAQKLKLAIGVYVLGSMAAEVAGIYTDRKIEKMADRWKKLLTSVQESETTPE